LKTTPVGRALAVLPEGEPTSSCRAASATSWKVDDDEPLFVTHTADCPKGEVPRLTSFASVRAAPVAGAVSAIRIVAA
jgi:hypothetical protein